VVNSGQNRLGPQVLGKCSVATSSQVPQLMTPSVVNKITKNQETSIHDFDFLNY
jgi:hypothetical protein